MQAEYNHSQNVTKYCQKPIALVEHIKVPHDTSTRYKLLGRANPLSIEGEGKKPVSVLWPN